MRACRTLLVRRTESDNGLAANERRPIRILERRVDRSSNGRTVVTVYAGNDLPAVSLEAFGGVIGKPASHFTVDGDVVVVVKANHLSELERACQRTCLMRDTFHQATVTQKDPRAVVHHRVPFTIERRGQHFLGQRHADRIGDSLAQWAGRRFDRKVRIALRVTGGPKSKLAEVSQFVDRQRISAQVQQTVQQHGAMPVRQDESVTVNPARIGGIVFQVVEPQDFGNICHSHRGARVAGVCRLYGVHAECADCIGPFAPGCLAGSNFLAGLL